MRIAIVGVLLLVWGFGQNLISSIPERVFLKAGQLAQHPSLQVFDALGTTKTICLLLGIYLVLEGLWSMIAANHMRRKVAVVRAEKDKELNAAKKLGDGFKEQLEHTRSEHRVSLLAAEESRAVASEKEAELRVTKSALAEAEQRAERDRSLVRDHPSRGGEVVQFLSLLQERGRFIDFVMEDISPYTDEQVAAAARVVHGGVSQCVKEHFGISPINTNREGDAVILDPLYDTNLYRPIGRVAGEPPYRGVLLHRGWKIDKMSLPETQTPTYEGRGPRVISPAEVEIV